MVSKCKYIRQNHCSNNQAENVAILKAPEELASLPDQTNITLATNTDSKVTLDSLKNNTIHSVLMEEIRIMVRYLTQQYSTVHFGWVKADAGIGGNEVTDTLAKKGAQDEENRNFVYDRIPVSTVASSVKKEGLRKWQAQCGKGSERSDLQILFSKRRAEAQITDPNNTRVHSYCQRSREDRSMFKFQVLWGKKKL